MGTERPRPEPELWKSLRHWWGRERESKSAVRVIGDLAAIFWEFLRESTPERRRRRYGDLEYDWERRVNTTSGGVGARIRLLGLLHSEYQPIEPELFREIVARMEIAFDQFTFVDIGSGKGRAVLLAAEYTFRRIVGIELLPELHAIAVQNVAEVTARESIKPTVDLQCSDAAQFGFPLEPLVVFLFNPLPELVLRDVVRNLDASLRESPRPVYVIYVNPVHDEIVSAATGLRKFCGTNQYSLYQDHWNHR
jgi:SAM-dependent methyltransferase